MLTLLALSGMLASATASRQPASGAHAALDGPGRLPTAERSEDRIRKLTGTTSSTAAVLQAEGTITKPTPLAFTSGSSCARASLVGERNLDATSCENLSGAAAVSLALLLRSEEPLSEADLGVQPAAWQRGPAGQQSTAAPTAAESQKPSQKRSARRNPPHAAANRNRPRQRGPRTRDRPIERPVRSASRVARPRPSYHWPR